MNSKNTFAHLGEIEEIIQSIKDMQDVVLGVYKYEPIKSKKLLKDLEELKEEAATLNKKFFELS